MIFNDARLKIERANHHINCAKTRIARMHETDTARIDVNEKTGGEILTHDFTDATAFDDIALIVGDAVHNLNCALDYTWLQTIERFAPSLVKDRAKFPVHKTINEVQGSLAKAEVDTICQNLYRFMLDAIKPCEGGDHAIWPIHSLDNRDKHRLLLPVLSQATLTGIRVVDEHGETWPGFGATAAFQRPPYIIAYERGIHVKDKGKITAQIAVQNGKLGYPVLIPESLMTYAHFILRTVELFEAFGELGASPI